MKISIDTKEDSIDHIKSVIKVLNSIVEQNENGDSEAEPILSNQVKQEESPIKTTKEGSEESQLSSTTNGNIFGNVFEAPNTDKKRKDDEEDEYNLDITGFEEYFD